MIPSLLFLVGLLIGSFANVCILRIPADESIVFPGSRAKRDRFAAAPAAAAQRQPADERDVVVPGDRLLALRTAPLR